MRRRAKFALIAALTVGAAVIGFRVYRGPTDASSEYGGELAALPVPDFSSLSPERWVNGAPTSLASLRGSVVLIEAWHPT